MFLVYDDFVLINANVVGNIEEMVVLDVTYGT